MKGLCCSMLLLCTAALVLPAEKIDRSFYYDYGEKFYYEVSNVPGRADDSTRFLVFFRLRHDLLAFTTVSDQRLRQDFFMARPVLYVEFADSLGVIRHSTEWRDTVLAGSYESTISKKEYVFGVLECSLSPGTYSVSLEVGDQKTPRSLRRKIPRAVGRDFRHSGQIADVIFAESPSDDAPEYVRPFALKGDLPFASDLRVLAAVSGVESGTRFTYELQRVLPTDSDKNKLLFSEFVDIVGEAEAMMETDLRIDPSSNSKGIVLERFVAGQEQGTGLPFGREGGRRNDQGNDSGTGLLDFFISGATMEPGAYTLAIYRQGSRDTLRRDFRVSWLNQPLSLRNLRYAIELTYYLTTDEEYEELTSGSKMLQRKKFLRFWQERDPSPGTAYNEAMAEFFARVDFAYFNYQTLGQQDGARTDRGKIFILHGPPSDTERMLDPDKPLQEVWTYSNNVKKQFVFESESSGKFILRQIVDL